ncbi:TasA family protein [Fredinandcohnia salidurans]|uniref:TasA family protein n=1 Tax=Fredinandcohnia salidurans TaxID=2595041 RepID=A0ABW4MUH2_9BACI
MSIKKKIGLGVASAALGLSLVGGGTWAAFNDVDTIKNHFAAGTLDLDIQDIDSNPINFDLTNMKPGDSVERKFRLGNKGSLAIKEVLLSATASGFTSGVGTNKSRDAFLDQFEIELFKVQRDNGNMVSVWTSNGPLTLKEFVNQDFGLGQIVDNYEPTDKSKRINLVPLVDPLGGTTFATRGLPVDPQDTDDVYIKITFVKDNQRVGGDYSEFVQNKFMGNSVSVQFNLEATQWAGVEVEADDANGAVNNGVQGSADDTKNPTTQPNDRTTGTPTITDPVND